MVTGLSLLTFFFFPLLYSLVSAHQGYDFRTIWLSNHLHVDTSGAAGLS